MLEINNIYHGDCLELMNYINDNSVNMILTDLPFGTTKNIWDLIIPFNELWKQYNRIIKDNGVIALHCQQPFTTQLIASNLKMFRYNWTWIKQQGTGFLNANKMPLKATEDIAIFYKKLPKYNPQMRTGFKSYQCKTGKQTTNYNSFKQILTTSDGSRFPLNWLEFKYDKDKFHPTQKPTALIEYLIKTYTDKNDIVLDSCAGSGTVGVACINTNRNYILIEKDLKYFNIAQERINQCQDLLKVA